jgi:diguanylate cyclase (GGDEF)-like protein
MRVRKDVAGGTEQRPSRTDWICDAIEASGDVLYEWDIASDRMYWAGRSSDLLGSERAVEALSSGAAFNSRINPEDLPQRLKALSDHLNDGVAYDCEYRVRSDNGTFAWVHDRGAAQFSSEGEAVRVVGTLRPVTARKQHEARLERLANFDELTGHLNKARVRDALEHALAFSRRASVPGAFLVVGVDKLAWINNTFGYEVGDKVLIGVGRCLDACLRSCDIIGRIGADRFGVILGKCNEEQMARATDRILQSLRETPIEIDLAPVHITVSIGGMAFPSHPTSAYDVMTKAETSLKQAKREGRDRFCAYQASDPQSEELRRSLDLAAQVTQAMRDRRLMLAYQPIVTEAGEPAFYECLLRLRDLDGRVVPAGSFIAAVEQLGLVRTVDRYVLELAVDTLAETQGINLAINISGLTVSDASWLRSLRAMLIGKPEIAERLIVEITETAALHDIEESSRFITTVRDLGCRVAVDDFGAGFTSFSHLKALTIDIVKVDGSFIKDIDSNPDNQLFVRNLLGLANAFGLETVAECVETAAEAAFVAAEGVTYQQGWFYAKPSLEVPQAAPKPKRQEIEIEPLRAAG